MEIKGASDHSGEKQTTILERIKSNILEWKDTDFDKVSFQRMSGLSNACYKVAAPGL